MALRIRGEDAQDPGSLADCQASRPTLHASKAGHTFIAVCGSAGFFHLTGYLQPDLTKSVFSDVSSEVPVLYGGSYIEAMDAQGGWIASASDVIRFTLCIEGQENRSRVTHRVGAVADHNAVRSFLDLVVDGAGKGEVLLPGMF